jgi:signal transduction histidine kinase
MQRLFEPFFSTRIGEGGTGLGMSIVQSIVSKSLGGSMHVHSTPGQGTRYDITLPRSAPHYIE